MKLEGKVAVVTGGARGIGRAIAEGYAAEGATVAICDVLKDVAEDTAAAIGGSAFAVELDVTSAASRDAMVEAVVARAGKIDILVNGAAIFEMAPLVEDTEASFDRQFGINVKGLMFTTQAVVRQMLKQRAAGDTNRYKIIHLASQAGRRGEALVTIYGATKAAVISMTQANGMELIKHDINVNGIAPGVVDTPMWDVVDSLFAKYEGRPIGDKKREVGENVPYGRMGKPEDHIGAAVFLASSDSDYVVAQTLNVDGGNWMS